MFTTWLAALVLTTASVQESRSDMPQTAAPVQDAPVAAEPAETPAAPPDMPAQAAGPQLRFDTAPAEPDIVRTSARDYAAFHHTVADLREAPIGSAEDLDTAMDRLSVFYGEERLVRAWIAYAAIVAAHHPEYLDEIRELADYYGPQAAISGLMYDPAYATSFGSAAAAQDSVVDAIERDNEEIREVSQRYRTAAYDLQSERWANRVYRDRAERLARIVEVSDDPILMPDELSMSLDTGLDAGVPASALFERLDAVPVESALGPQLTLTVGEATPDPDRTRIGRILSVAALQSIDGTMGTDTDAAIDNLLADPSVERCLAWVRLDLQQCVAAGHFKYEDSFCIAEHALLDVSRCLATANPAQ
ncbi:hypothetical protein [Maricaulis sp.]|uniref:hypothetical protein n=1 Tax=Maricaulis sp. TaxID=1486257 RepID=UPI002603EE37|nr:hypothetical protein [Maricaulis sp.]